jgi:hypothetical protein
MARKRRRSIRKIRRRQSVKKPTVPGEESGQYFGRGGHPKGLQQPGRSSVKESIQRLPAASRTVYAACDTFSSGFEILVIDYAELVSANERWCSRVPQVAVSRRVRGAPAAPPGA